MDQERSVKYYDGLAVQDGREVSAEEARRLPCHVEAFLGPGGDLEKVALYDGQMLRRIDYHDGRTAEEARSSHLEEHRDVPFTIRRRQPVGHGFEWELVWSYTGHGGFDGFTVVLQDEAQRGWMEVEMDETRAVRRVTKYSWEGPDDLRYVFEYGSDGVLVSVDDVAHGDHASFAELKADLPEPEFFERGLSLPRVIAGTVIPS